MVTLRHRAVRTRGDKNDGTKYLIANSIPGLSFDLIIADIVASTKFL